MLLCCLFGYAQTLSSSVSTLKSDDKVNPLKKSIGPNTEVRKLYHATFRENGPCSESEYTSLNVWISEDKDLGSNNVSGIKVYTTQTGTGTVSAGYYTFLYPISGSTTGYRSFYIDSNGTIVNYTNCQY